MISGVTFSAAQIKSPSFSRSSASIAITISPRRMASTAASIVDNRFDTLYSSLVSGQFNMPMRRRRMKACHPPSLAGPVHETL